MKVKVRNKRILYISVFIKCVGVHCVQRLTDKLVAKNVRDLLLGIPSERTCMLSIGLGILYTGEYTDDIDEYM